ncbi:MAG: glutathione S-transferase family protein [Candidatus Thiodiazotropha sp.]
MIIKLVSFLLCPYVQRSVILLEKKQIQYQIEYIDLEQPPAWFNQLSPMGKVPLMLVDGEVLFESAVILEFLDESFLPSLQPQDNLKRAQHKAWIEFGSSLLVAQHGMAMAPDMETMDERKRHLEAGLLHLLPPLEQGLFGGPAHFSLVDAAFAPLFMRLDLLAGMNPLVRIDYPGPVAEWAERLSSLPCVKGSVVEDFNEQFRRYLEKKGAWLVSANPS